MENEKFDIEIDGVINKADMLKVITFEDQEYAIYAVDKGDETSDVLASRLVKNEDGTDTLVDLTDEERPKLTEIVQAMFQ